jgi:uncharacterized protein YjbK
VKVLILIALTLSCATSRSEMDAYNHIMRLQKKEYFSEAAYEVFKYEAAYPQGEHICELWDLQIDHLTNRQKNAGFLEKVRDKKRKKCAN